MYIYAEAPRSPWGSPIMNNWWWGESFVANTDNTDNTDSEIDWRIMLQILAIESLIKSLVEASQCVFSNFWSRTASFSGWHFIFILRTTPLD